MSLVSLLCINYLKTKIMAKILLFTNKWLTVKESREDIMKQIDSKTSDFIKVTKESLATHYETCETMKFKEVINLRTHLIAHVEDGYVSQIK